MKAVIKIGGALLETRESREALAREIKDAFASHDIVVVHGWGKQLTKHLTDNGIETKFVNGLRVTTKEVLDGVKIVSKRVNRELVDAFNADEPTLLAVGLEILGVGMVDVVPMGPELGYVGRPINANAQLLDLQIRLGQLPVIACVGKDANGQIYNVNADQVAASCAQAFQACKLIFLTDVPGVAGPTNERLQHISAEQAQRLIDSAVATGGMQAKLNAALSALSAMGTRTREVVIAPGNRQGVVAAALADVDIGTRVTLA